MIQPRELYMLHDSADGYTPAKQVDELMAHHYNHEGYGIFWTVNDFGGDRRRKVDLKHIRSWIIEFDDEPKSSQYLKLKSGILPSLVVESNAGYHVYFDAIDARPEHYKAIQEAIIDAYGADPKCKDVTRLLRAPGFYHMKNPESPFLVRTVWEYDVQYTEADMSYWFKVSSEKPKEHLRETQELTGGLFDRVYTFDCHEALSRLSGSYHVKGEVYTFAPQANGHLNIIVDGKQSSCFIDTQGKIGSMDNGGPSVWQWLRWFGHSDKEVYQICKQEFPELWT